MIKGFFDMFEVILKAVFWLLSPFIVMIALLFLSFFLFMLINYKRGYRFNENKKSPYKKDSFFKRVFIQFPDRLSKDLYLNDPNSFKEHSLHLFCGEQGSGKTTAVVHKLQELKKRYPLSKCRTNMSYKDQDGSISHWKDLVSNNNGIYGQIEVLDEIQTWFSSNQSKDFPPEMITEISQQRKQRKMIIGTAQVFSRVAKPIREQTAFVYLPMTFMGCLTFVRITKPQYWSDDKMCFKRYIGYYFFVHTDEIRNAFDTYEKIEKYTSEGFQGSLKERYKEVI